MRVVLSYSTIRCRETRVSEYVVPLLVTNDQSGTVTESALLWGDAAGSPRSLAADCMRTPNDDSTQSIAGSLGRDEVDRVETVVGQPTSRLRCIGRRRRQLHGPAVIFVRGTRYQPFAHERLDE
jgi:hypothetical protein